MAEAEAPMGAGDTVITGTIPKATLVEETTENVLAVPLLRGNSLSEVVERQYSCGICHTVHSVPAYVVKFTCTSCKHIVQVDLAHVEADDLTLSAVPLKIVWAFRASAAVMLAIWLYTLVAVVSLSASTWVQVYPQRENLHVITTQDNSLSDFVMKKKSADYFCPLLTSNGELCSDALNCASFFCTQNTTASGLCTPLMPESTHPQLLFAFCLIFYSLAIWGKLSASYSLQTEPDRWVIRGLWGFNLKKLPDLDKIRASESALGDYSEDDLWMQYTGLPLLLAVMKYFCLDPIFALQEACGTTVVYSVGDKIITLAYIILGVVGVSWIRKKCKCCYKCMRLGCCCCICDMCTDRWPKCEKCCRYLGRAYLFLLNAGLVVTLLIAYEVKPYELKTGGHNPHWVFILKVMNFVGLVLEVITLLLIRFGSNEVIRLRSKTAMHRFLYKREAVRAKQAYNPALPANVVAPSSTAAANRSSLLAEPATDGHDGRTHQVVEHNEQELTSLGE